MFKTIDTFAVDPVTGFNFEVGFKLEKYTIGKNININKAKNPQNPKKNLLTKLIYDP